MSKITFNKIDDSKLYKVGKDGYFQVRKRDGKTYKFNKYHKLLNWIYQNNIRLSSIGNSWNEKEYTDLYYTDHQYWGGFVHAYGTFPKEFIIFDIDGKIVHPDKIKDDIEKFHPIIKSNLNINYHFNKRLRHIFRRPKTTQELRRNSWDKDYARSKRCKSLLPSSYDDISIKANKVKSWKKIKQRKQWMKKD